MPRPPRCLPGTRPAAFRLAARTPARPAAPAPAAHRAARPTPMRSVLDTPHRRRAALVLMLAMLLTVWLRQVTGASISDQPIVAEPLTRVVSLERLLS